ncbi:Uncharacterised protein [Zhongshania aliphaticivorans]|uniref:Uncharacterized protein n=1 Tax=Zhongshania aliphaticivorans TaxID=1470434 RepID=A0A5S9NA30_9GAMM|nr:hypothetical protein [Zhongshania aliphaticivorans]CAA0079837.1 Uncharacterised protein [Zhongshania aliphaticivorans]CAA0085995.1 Uncharacterised protein [Zhongshania aliphaticivorans]
MWIPNQVGDDSWVIEVTLWQLGGWGDVLTVILDPDGYPGERQRMPVYVATCGVSSRFGGLWIPNQVEDDVGRLGGRLESWVMTVCFLMDDL